MSEDSFTQTRLKWLEQLSLDPDLNGLALRTAMILATRYFNRHTREAFPKQETLAAAIGASERGVRMGIRQLVDRGHLTVVRTGKRDRNRYRLRLRKAETTLGHMPADLVPRAGPRILSRAPDTGTTVPLADVVTGTPVPLRAEPPFPSGEEPQFLQNPLSTNPLNEPSESSSQARPKRTAPSATATRLPDDWILPAAYREFARANGFTDPEIDDLATEFHDYWTTREGAKRRDWESTWRSRVRDVAARRNIRHSAQATAPALGRTPQRDAYRGDEILKGFARAVGYDSSESDDGKHLVA